MMEIRRTPACKPFTPNNFIEISAKYFDALETDGSVDATAYSNMLHETILLFLDFFEIADLDYDKEIDFQHGSPFYECILEPNEDFMMNFMVTLQFAEIF